MDPSAPKAVLQRVLSQYSKQLVASRTMAFHQQTLQMMTPEEERTDPDAKRRLVIQRVARELWTNFSVRGEETPMFRHLCQRLREEYDSSLEFRYRPGSIDLCILRATEDGLVPVSSREKVEMLNRAWKIALQVVESYVV